MTKPIRVLIVEDSLVVRELLKHIIGSDARFDVVGAVESAEDALKLMDVVEPDVISLDIRLPGMNGLDATLQIMARRPTPIVVVSANVDDDELNIAMNALRAGALAVVEKPVGVTNIAFEAMAARLCTQLAIMSQVKVVRQGNRGLSFGTAEPMPMKRPRSTGYSMLGIVSSTGGPQALVQVLGGLEKNFPLPILLVQHITASFLDGFVSWLGGVTPFDVRVALNGEVPEPGKVYVPPQERHLVLRGGKLVVLDDPPVHSQKPSGTVLLSSMAKHLGHRAVGVVLTGMGSDGADGMLDLEDAGGYTIAEHESTCVVYGMPAAAAKLGAVKEMLPLHDIAPRLAQLTAGGAKA